MQQEIIWKPVVGYEGLYEVSNTGLVKSLSKGRNKILKLTKSTDHYYRVTLCKNKANDLKRVLVHRLVAEAFVPNPENKPIVNHIDMDHYNNNSTNLEWVTQAENLAHSHNNGVSTCRKKGGKNKKVRNKLTGEIYRSIRSAAKALNVSEEKLYRRLNGEIPNTTHLEIINDSNHINN